MRLPIHPVGALAVGLLATALITTAVAAEELTQSPEIVVQLVQPPWERKIRAALDQHTHLAFIETPLVDVVDFLKDLHRIEIQIDKRALEDVGIGTDTPITKCLKGISLRSALRLVLRELDSTYVIRDEVLLITIPEEAGRRPVTKVYRVGTLVDFGESAEDLAATVAPFLQPRDARKSRPRLVPHRDLLILHGTMRDHDTLEELLHGLHRAIHLQPGETRTADRAAINTMARSGPEQKVEAALGEPTMLQFIETPLQQVVDYLRDLHKIEIQIDTRALADLGLASDSPITFNITGVSLRSALRLILRQLDLTHVVRDEVLLITTAEESATPPRTRVYCVANLLDFGQSAEELAQTLQATLSRETDLSQHQHLTDEAAKKVRLPRIVPYRQALIVHGTPEDFEDFEDLVQRLSLGLRGVPGSRKTTSARVSGQTQDKTPSAGLRTNPFGASRRNGKTLAGAPSDTKRDGPDDNKKPATPSGKAGSVDVDPFGGGSASEDPFGGGSTGNDPFKGGGNAGDDPFGGASRHDDDPFGGGSSDDDDPFGERDTPGSDKADENKEDPDPFR